MLKSKRKPNPFIDYQSSEQREALRISSQGLDLTIEIDSHVFSCLDISVSGCSLVSKNNYAFQKYSEFNLYFNQQYIGVLNVRLVQCTDGIARWSFLKKDNKVAEFLDDLVLTVQKDQIRQSKKSNLEALEREILLKP